MDLEQKRVRFSHLLTRNQGKGFGGAQGQSQVEGNGNVPPAVYAPPFVHEVGDAMVKFLEGITPRDFRIGVICV